LIAGNWKMNGLTAQLREIAAVAASVTAKPPAADILICPPATLIVRAAQVAAGRIDIGGQDCHTGVAGAFTGDISAQMLKDAGASWVIVGHSERRQQHGDTDALVAAKASAAGRAGLQVIICIGETQSQRGDGTALAVCGDQLAGSLPEGLASYSLAYEPLWAIGSGHIPTSQQIEEMHAHIRDCLERRFGPDGRGVRILYGGSVKPSNAREILSLPEVGGALIGGASLKAKDFEGILQAISIDVFEQRRAGVGDSMMRIGIGADHGGFALKETITQSLRSRGYDIVDFGAHRLNPTDDYPEVIVPLARAMAAGQLERAVALCGSGVGASIAANKIPGVRAGLIHDVFSARQGVEDDDMNVLCLGGKVIGIALALELIETFLNARFSGAPRHRRRLAELRALEHEET
jgi:triosephosphate isomerase